MVKATRLKKEAAKETQSSLHRLIKKKPNPKFLAAFRLRFSERVNVDLVEEVSRFEVRRKNYQREVTRKAFVDHLEQQRIYTYKYRNWMGNEAHCQQA
ncbi:hypothetical protein L2E82_04013 [Cichorium intybus]|uniref:Uncharacterized protein n=1 Tax=Cichorium intybus TaxID=13427 RepID=A0ACB9H4T7_CICIN|nr:hypothetical protein L2E82_04013 [Cichorium intybus]